MVIISVVPRAEDVPSAADVEEDGGVVSLSVLSLALILILLMDFITGDGL